MKHDKLTLRLEEEAIKKAKRFAHEHGTSVSKLVARFFDSLETPRSADERYGPITKRLRGSLASGQVGPQVDEEDYLRHLEEKHG